ncbi:MAG TPA: BREX system P-loop protein BrxC, partial [Thermoanaerobaculia bacterium]|nr:BREX system P-loop protein BrxC [Thermoanaerobaculia bacterium]
IASEYERRYHEALEQRIDAYKAALESLRKTSEWAGIPEEKQPLIAAPLERGTLPERDRSPIPQLRADRDACASRLKAALAEVHKILAGERYAAVDLGSYFEGGIENEEQLDKALAGIREECSRLIGAGKKVVVL